MTIKNHKIKNLTSPEWAMKFFARKIQKYWSQAKKLVNVEITLLCVFLNYERAICRYKFTFLNRRGRKEQKNIILKTQKTKKGFLWPPRIGTVRRDYLALKFLEKNKLKFAPLALDFYPNLHAYIYEEIPGATIKKLFPKKEKIQTKKIFEYLPKIVQAIRTVHNIKKRPPYAAFGIEKKINLQFISWIKLIKKFYPSGYQKFQKILKILKKIQKKYQNILFDEKNFSLTHGDFQMDNILINKRGGIILIDWADSNFANPLDDISSFLVQTEMHLKYISPAAYLPLFQKIKNGFMRAYFRKEPSLPQQMQIDFFEAVYILRIITFVSFTQANWHPQKYSKMMNNLLNCANNKIEILKKNYL